MDRGRFDRLTRAFASRTTGRRGLFALALGAVAWAQAREATSAPTTCSPENAHCGISMPCCDGLVCHLNYTNPAAGSCKPGTGAVGWVIVHPSGIIDPSAITPAATETPRPTKTPRATRTPRNATATSTAAATSTPGPTSTPTAIPDTAWSISAKVYCDRTPEETIITNTGSLPVMFSRVKSTFNPREYSWGGNSTDPNSPAVIPADPTKPLTVYSAVPLSDTSKQVYDNKELFQDKSTAERIIVTVQRLRADLTAVNSGNSFLELVVPCTPETSTSLNGEERSARRREKSKNSRKRKRKDGRPSAKRNDSSNSESKRKRRD